MRRTLVEILAFLALGAFVTVGTVAVGVMLMAPSPIAPLPPDVASGSCLDAPFVPMQGTVVGALVRLCFDADEIRGAYVLAKKARPKTPVTLNQMIRLVASLGGFLGRKSDGEPGAKTIWIGMQRTMDAALTIQALRDES